MKAINTNSKSTLDKASRTAVQFGVGQNIENPTPGKAEEKKMEPYIVCVRAIFLKKQYTAHIV